MIAALSLFPEASAQGNTEVGEPFSFHGEVVSVGVPGQGLVLALEDQNVAVHGLGPLWFWDAMGWTWPMVGDTIIAKGHLVLYGGRTFHVAQELLCGDSVMRLRNPQSGLPLWHGQGLYVPLKEERP